MSLSDNDAVAVLRVAGWTACRGERGLWTDGELTLREAHAVDRALSDCGLELADDGSVRARADGSRVLPSTVGLAAFVAGVRWARSWRRAA